MLPILAYLGSLVPRLSPLRRALTFLVGRAWERGYTWVQFTEITQLLLEFFVVKDHLTDGVLFLLDVGFSCGHGSHVTLM